MWGNYPKLYAQVVIKCLNSCVFTRMQMFWPESTAKYIKSIKMRVTRAKRLFFVLWNNNILVLPRECEVSGSSIYLVVINQVGTLKVSTKGFKA